MKDDFAAEWLDLVTALAPEQCLDVATRIASRLNALRGDDSGRSTITFTELEVKDPFEGGIA